MTETDNSARNENPRPEKPERFESVEALRGGHTKLLQRAREDGESPELWDDVERFVCLGQATGVLLDSPTDRRASQSLLDYWANRLYRAGREPPLATLAEFDLTEAPELPDEPCPYLGLDAFSEADAPFFFGRQRLVTEMVDRLGSDRLLAMIGPSGCGKSSVVTAGLLPELKTGALPGSEAWRCYGPLVPGSNPLAKLARLFRPPGADPGDWDLRQIERFSQDPQHLLRLAAETGEGPVVLVIDQFEELFTLCRDEALRLAFVDNLLALMEAPEGGHCVIITMRGDFEPHVTRLPAFHAHYKDAVLHVPPLSASEMREAIEGPAQEVGLRFEEGLVESLLHDLLGEPAALPLLQFTLLRLWEKRQRNRVTLATYQQVGGGRLALARAADELYESLIPQNQTAAERILLRLALPSEGLEVTRQRVRRKILFQIGLAPSRIKSVLDTLVQARLVRLTPGDTPDDAQVEIAHEALLRNWPRLVEWLEDEREVIRKRLRLTAAAEQWAASGWDDGALWGGTALDQALRYEDLSDLERQFVEASLAYRDKEEAEREAQRQRELEQAKKLLEAERQRADEAEAHRKSLSRQRLIIAIFAVIAVIAFVFALTQLLRANDNREQAEQNAALAETQAAEAVAARQTAEAASADAAAERDKALNQEEIAEAEAEIAGSLRLAAQSVDNLDSDAQLSLLLAVEALSVTHTVQAERALRQALEESRVRAILRKHSASINAVAFCTSASGSLLASASDDGTARLWEVATGDQIAVVEHEAAVQVVAFSPEGDWLATGGDDGLVQAWRVDGSLAEPVKLRDHVSTVTLLAFSADGRHLTSADRSGSLAVWDLSTLKLATSLPGPVAEVSALALSSDGGLLATATYTGTVRLWAVDPGQAAAEPLAELAGHETGVNIMAFSPDDRWLAAAAADGTVRLWDVTSSGEGHVLTGHAGGINVVAFNSPVTVLATGGEDGTVQIWNVGDLDQDPRVLRGHSGPIYSVAFLPRSTKLATCGGDRTARLWNRRTGEMEAVLRGHESSVIAVAFSPEGKLLATADSAGVARLWAVAGDEPQITLGGHAGGAAAVAFSPDGSLLATGDYSGTVHLWDFATVVGTGGANVESVDLPEARGWVFDLAFSPDGQLLAGTTMGSDRELGQAYLWDLSSISAETTGQDIPVLPLDSERNVALGVAFSPDGGVLAASSIDPNMESSAIHLWQIEGFGTGSLATMAGLPGIPFDLAFNPASVGSLPAGSLLATSLADWWPEGSNLIFWDISQIHTGGDGSPRLASLYDEEGFVFLAFSPDGQNLAAGNYDGTVHLWDVAALLETGGRSPEAAILTGHEDMVLGVAFSRDSTLLATGARDGTARLWDVPTALETGGSGAEVTVLEGHEEWAYDVAFSPDRRWLVTSDQGGAVRLWALDTETLQEVACSHAVRNLSLTEWQEYLGVTTPYRRTCRNLRVHPTVVEDLVRQGKTDEALAALHQATELDPTLDLGPEQEAARLLMEVAEEHIARFDSEGALTALQRAVELNEALDIVPEEYVAWALVEQARSLRWCDEMLAVLAEAVDLAPAVKTEAADVLFEFVTDRIVVELIPHDEAIGAIEQAVEWDPDLKIEAAETLFLIGQDYIDQGSSDQGLALWHRAVEWDPSLEVELRVEEVRVQALQAAADGSFGEAVASLEQLPDLSQLGWSGSLRVAETYGAVCRQGMDGDQADQVLTACQRAIELAGEFDEVWLGRTLCLREDVAGLLDDIATACEGFGGPAIQLSLGETVTSTIEAEQEQFWTFEGTKDQVVRISMVSESDSLDPYLVLVGPDGEVLAENDDWIGFDSLIEATLPEAGLYFIVASGVGDSTGAYTLSLILEEE